MKQFLFGVLTGVSALFLLGFVWLFAGGLPMATSGGPLPFEKILAHIALDAAIRNEIDRPSPVTADEVNLISGAKIYRTNCAICHGLSARTATAISAGLFPPPPELMPPHKGVTDDSVGETFWKVKNGIRLTGMPGFTKSLSEQEMWQVSELLLNADKLPQAVKAELEK